MPGATEPTVLDVAPNIRPIPALVRLGFAINLVASYACCTGSTG